LPAAAAGVLLAALLTIYLLWWAPGPKPGPHAVIVQEGATLGSVSRQLAKAGAIPGSARTYYVMARLLGSGDPILNALDLIVVSDFAGIDGADRIRQRDRCQPARAEQHAHGARDSAGIGHVAERARCSGGDANCQTLRRPRR